MWSKKRRTLNSKKLKNSGRNQGHFQTQKRKGLSPRSRSTQTQRAKKTIANLRAVKKALRNCSIWFQLTHLRLRAITMRKRWRNFWRCNTLMKVPDGRRCHLAKSFNSSINGPSLFSWVTFLQSSARSSTYSRSSSTNNLSISSSASVASSPGSPSYATSKTLRTSQS